MENRPRLIITVPHSKVDPNKKIRHYDLRAAAAAEALKKAAEKLHPNLEIIILLSDTIREKCDLNRDNCLMRPWRQNLNKIIRSIDYHIDCHSYPNTMESFLMVGVRNALNQPKAGVRTKKIEEEMAALTPPPLIFIFNKDNNFAREYGSEFAAAAGAVIVPPDDDEIIVSILRQSKANRKVLIEFNEKYDVLSDEKLDEMAAKIIKYFIRDDTSFDRPKTGITHLVGEEEKKKIGRGNELIMPVIDETLTIIIFAGVIITILLIIILFLRDKNGKIFGIHIPEKVIVALGILFVLIPP
jgi:hypothetical protein